MTSALLIFVGIWAGAQNALAGGGTFITLPALILAGLDPRAANITSTVALFPGQVITGVAGRRLHAGVERLSFRALMVISLVGGGFGGLLLLISSPSFFAALVPWLVLFATGVFAWGSFRPRRVLHASEAVCGKPYFAGLAQFGIAIYGGYFGGGIGFLMLAVLTMAGQAVRNAGATKNALAAAMNASAVAILIFSNGVHWLEALALCGGSILGGLIGSWMLERANEKLLRAVVVLIGVALTIGLFVTR